MGETQKPEDGQKGSLRLVILQRLLPGYRTASQGCSVYGTSIPCSPAGGDCHLLHTYSLNSKKLKTII